MQILPDSFSHEAPAIIPAEGGEVDINQNSPFAEVMNSIKEYAETHSDSPKYGGAAKSYEKAASAKDKGFGEGARVSQQELARIRQKLESKGLSKEDIEELEARANSEEGLTWGDLLQFVADKLEVAVESIMPQLTADMKNDLTSLFDKMGFSHEEAKALIRDLEAGKLTKVRQALSSRAAEMDDTELTSITRGELKTLGKALGLPAAAMQRLEGMLGSQDTQTISAKGTRVALNTIFADAKDLQKKLDDTLGELRTVIQEGMLKARDAKKTLELADNRETKEVAASKVLIKEEAKEKRSGEQKGENSEKSGASNKGNKAGIDADEEDASADKKSKGVSRQESVIDGKKNASSEAKASTAENKDSQAKAEAVKADLPEDAKGENHKAEKVVSEDSGKNSKKAEEAAKQGIAPASTKTDSEGGDLRDAMARSFQDGKEAAGSESSAAADKKGGEQGASSKDSDGKAFDHLWNKGEAQSAKAAGDASLLDGNRSENLDGKNFSLKSDRAELLLGEKVPPQRIARTVQQGIMQNLSQGGKQLTLRLDPPALGKLTVILQVNHSEVRALIKTDNVDATRLVNDQVNLIRHSLEQQGLKVEKLDVQTQANNDQGPKDWQGAEQHNQMQERNRESLEAFMAMRRAQRAQGDVLAREVQSVGERAHIAHHHQGLHLIA